MASLLSTLIFLWKPRLDGNRRALCSLFCTRGKDSEQDSLCWKPCWCFPSRKRLESNKDSTWQQRRTDSLLQPWFQTKGKKTWANRIRLDPPAASPKWPNAAAKPCWKQEDLAIRLWIGPRLCWNMRYVSTAPLTLFALKVAALPPLPLPHPSAVLLLMGSQAQSCHFYLKV